MGRVCCGHAVCPVLVALLAILALLSYRSDSATHWVLKKTGRIEVRPSSPYDLRKPYDLLAFVQQEEYGRRLKHLNQVLKDNSHKLEKADIEKDDDKLVEANFYKTDKDCTVAPRRLADVDLYSSTYLPLDKKGIKMTDHLTCAPGTYLKGVPQVPDCRKPPLDFSPKAYEHLQGVQARSQLQSQPEPALHGAFPKHFVMEDLGSCLKEALDRNSTSWVLLNVASLYWRIHGHYYQAAECLRRALHFSPPQHRDVALLSLGNILHRSQHSKDAVILLLTAIDLSPHLFIHHFTLGNVYAVNREWNLSAASYQRANQIESTIPASRESMHAVRCQQKLEDLLTHRQQALEKTLRDLEEYQAQHLEFQNVHQHFVDNINSKETDDDPFFGPLNSGIDDDVVRPYEHNHTGVAAEDNVRRQARKKRLEGKREKRKQGATTAAAATAAKAKKEAAEKNAGHKTLEQCPAGSETKRQRHAGDGGSKEQMCSAEEAVHHGQSSPKDEPEEEKDQCLVTEVTTEEIEDMRARMDWSAMVDTSDSSIELARTEVERIMNSLDDADPQLIALVKERLKSLSGNRLDAEEFNMLSTYGKPPSGAESCHGLKDDLSTATAAAGRSTGVEDGGEERAKRDSAGRDAAGKNGRASGTRLELPEDSSDDNIVVVTPEVEEDEEVDEYADDHVDLSSKKSSSGKAAAGDDTAAAAKVDRFKIRKCERPPVWITRGPESNGYVLPRERVPSSQDYGRPATLSERVCHRYGEEQFDKYAVEIGKPPPDGVDLFYFPFKYERTQEKGSNNNGNLLDIGEEIDAEELQKAAVPFRRRKKLRLHLDVETSAELNAQREPQQRIPCLSDGRPSLVSGLLSIEERDMLLNKAARDHVAMAEAVEQVTNELLNLSTSLPGNIHAPKLRVKMPSGKKADTPTPPLVPAEPESSPRPASKESKPSPHSEPKETKTATKPANEAELRWIQEQTRFVEVSEEKRLRGPQMPIYLRPNVSWDDVYKGSPRTVIGMTRRQDDTVQRVLQERRNILSKIQLLPLRNTEPREEEDEETVQYDKDTRLPVYESPEVTAQECESLPATPTWDHFPAVYLPPEARGVNVSELLAVGLPPSYLHPQPWLPPICVHYAAVPHTLKAYDHLLGIQYRDQLPMVPEPALNNLVGSLVDPDTTLEEIGQRLTTAFEMSAQPVHWAVFHIAGLFFRVVGNPFHALECFRRAAHFAPLVARDVPLVGMAEILHRTGQMSDAIVLLRAALDVHPEQVQTHLALGNALASNGQFFQARLHHSYACERQPSLEAACLAVRYDECYSRRDVPQSIVNAAFRKDVVPSCTLNECKLSDTILRRKYDVISHASLFLATSELPEIVHRTDSVMRKHFKQLPSDFVSQSLQRLSAARQVQARTVAEVREMLIKDQERMDVLLKGPAQTNSTPGAAAATSAAGTSAAGTSVEAAAAKAEKAEKATGKKYDASLLSRSRPVSYRAKVKLPEVTEEACKAIEDLNLKELTSTWLSVEVKKSAVEEHIDLSTPESTSREKRKEPFLRCPEHAQFSVHMMDHLEGIQDRQRFEHINLAEPGLSQVMFGGLGGKLFSLASIGGRINDALKKNETSWVLQNLAALFWRLKGRADLSLRCLRQALHYSPQQSRDIGLVSMANVMARTRLFRDALILMSMALEISPNFVVHHFTIANILAATGNYKQAEFFYHNTLSFQPDFEPAAYRYLAVRCKLYLKADGQRQQERQPQIANEGVRETDT